jgi:hypothetical protein
MRQTEGTTHFCSYMPVFKQQSPRERQRAKEKEKVCVWFFGFFRMFLFYTELLTRLGCPLNGIFHVEPCLKMQKALCFSHLQICKLSIISITMLENLSQGAGLQKRERIVGPDRTGDRGSNLGSLGRDSPIFLQFFYLFSIFFLNRF